MNRKKVLLGHLNSNGDCLFATVIARQIKEVDFLDCHLTWAVNSKCKQSVLLNPYVDDIWEIPTEKTYATEDEWKYFVSEVEKKKRNGDFDIVFLTQIIGNNVLNYDGGVRSSTYNNYPHKIKVSHQPIIHLSDKEVENVRVFAEKHQLNKYKQVILVECGPDSFETALNPESAYNLASEITAKNADTVVILSSNKQIETPLPNIIDASNLTFRENAELTKYCDLFIGCGSGITWLTTTNWSKKLNTILVVDPYHAGLPSMIYDHEYLNLPTGHIIEIKSDQEAIKKLLDCLDKISTDGFENAKRSFNETFRLTNYAYLRRQLELTLSKLDFGKGLSCLNKHIKRNGIQLIFTSQFRKLVWNLQLILINKLLKIFGLKKSKSN